MYYSHLQQWIDRKLVLPPFIKLDKLDAFFEYGGFLGLEKVYNLHEVMNHESNSIKKSWKLFKEYVESALEISDYNNESYSLLDRYESELIVNELGQPPEACYPIYIITVGSNEKEKVVYIGKTSSDKNRFSGGHRVALKLHDPKYINVEKKVYFCLVLFLTKKKEYLPLEWIHPLEMAEMILDSVESELISCFKPELNVMKMKRNYSKHPVSLHIQNNTNTSRFLNDVFV